MSIDARPRMPRPITSFLIVATACAVPGARSARMAAADQDSLARRLVVEQIRTKLGGQPRFRIDGSTVRWHSEPSRAVSGLTYLWGEFQPDVPSGPIAAVAGIRGDSVAALDRASAWSRVVAGWSPGDASAALAACLEFIRFGGTGAQVLDTVWVLRPANLDQALTPSAQTGAVRAKLGDADGRPRIENGAWVVDLWVRERRSGYYPFAMKYRCELPSAEGRGGAALSATDSVPGAKGQPFI